MVIEVHTEFDVPYVAEFLRRPDIYSAMADDLVPTAENIDFEAFLKRGSVFTYPVTYQGHMIGYVQFEQRTMIAAELHVGFMKGYRGYIAKMAIKYAMGKLFKDHGLIKVWASIHSDNTPAVRMAASLGFRHEGRLRDVIVKGGQLRDFILMGFRKDDWRI